MRLRPWRRAAKVACPLAQASPVAPKKIAMMTPDEPPIVWLSSLPTARNNCVRSASGIRSRDDFKARAAVASVLPVSPSPDFASNKFRSLSAATSRSQHSSINVRTDAFSEGIGLIGLSPSGSGLTVTVLIACIPGQSRNGISRASSFSVSSSNGRMETENPCMSSDVINGAGPIMAAMDLARVSLVNA